MLTGYIKPGNASEQEAMYTKEREDELEKAATLSTGTCSAVTPRRDTAGSRELWTRVLTSVGLST